MLKVVKPAADSHVVVFADGRVGVSVEDALSIPEGREVVSVVVLTSAEAEDVRARARNASADVAGSFLGAWCKGSSPAP